MRPASRLLAALAAVLLLAVAAPRASADTLLLKDGRTVECKKAVRTDDGKWRLTYEHGEVLVAADLVKEAITTDASGAYEPKDDVEKEKLAKGLVPFEGKWVPKSERDATTARRAAEAKKRIDEAKAHREWRNRYKAKTANFEFEYTIPPDIAKGYMDLMETYYAFFTKQFNVSRPPKEKLKVCFYHDYDTFLEVSGAGYGVLAYYRFVPPRELNFFYDRLRPEETVAIMFHEAQHYLSHLFDLKFNMPHNLGEAYAEYYGGSTWDPVKKVMTTGGLQEGRLTEVQTDIQGGERRSLEKYLRGELGYDDYTWGWTFVHFMMETPKYRPKFQRLYRALPDAKDITRTLEGEYATVKGDELVKAFQKYVGVDDLAALEKEWWDYIDKKLKAESVVGFEEAAFAALNTGQTLRAKRFFGLAVDKGSRNPTLYLRYGDLLRGDDNSKAGELYRKGLELDPLSPALWIALGRLTRGLGGDEHEATGTRYLKLAAELDPDSVDTALLLEEAARKVGEGLGKPGGGEGR